MGTMTIMTSMTGAASHGTWHMEIESLLQVLLMDGVVGGLESVLKIALILFPVLILIEFTRYYHLVEKISSRLNPLMNFLTLPREAAFPLVAGLSFGLVFGAALIIDYTREGILKRRDFMLVGIFLSINHAIIEDTIVFTAIGANPLVFLVTRFAAAVLLTRLAAFFLDRYGKESLNSFT